MQIGKWEILIAQKIKEKINEDDPAHDFIHFERVAKMAKYLCDKEQGVIEVVAPAAWLHDLVVILKDSPKRNIASRMSAEGAIEFLRSIEYPERFYDDIYHAIHGHSFSASVQLKTLEAKIVQDADRLDALGAIGIARCFTTAGILKRPLYSSTDPLCQSRGPDDSKYTLDHFFIKLFKIVDYLNTPTAIIEGRRRVAIMKNYLRDLASEISLS